MKLKTTLLAFATSVFMLSGCSSFAVSDMTKNKVEENRPYLEGMPLFHNRTPYTPLLECLAETSAENTQYLNQYRHTIAIGQIKDMTGKYDYENGGYKVTQGAADMMQAAIFKTHAFRVVDRNSMEITELERSLSTQKLVREFDLHDNQRVRTVTAGEVMGSDYKIVGSITELNYNVDSGGAEAVIVGIGAKARRYVADVGVDLFLVDTKTTQIVDVISVKKQLVGYEAKAGVFRFFGDDLYDINIGTKKQEPLQLAIRSAMEYAAYEFANKLYGDPGQQCLDIEDSIK